MIFRFKSVILRLFFIASSILIFSSADAARIYFNDVFKGTGSNYAEQTNSISNIQFISGSGFAFTSTDPADVTFRLTGNNVAGTLSYINAQGVKQSIIGQVSRQNKSQGTTIGLYFYTTTNEAFLLVIPGITSYTANSNVSTSSDPILAVMNDVLTAQNSQPKILVNDVSVSNTESFAVFTISLSSAANAIVTFSPTLTAVTASLNTDYTNSMQSFNGSTWVNITSTVSIAQGATNIQIRVPILNAGANLSRTFNLNTGSTSGGNILNSDGAFGVGTITPTPTITTTSTLKTFSVCSNYQNASQSISVSGSNLTNNIVLTAPVGYEISTTASSGYNSTITLTQSSGAVANTSIFIRTLTSNTTSGTSTLTMTSTGAGNKNTTLTANSDNALAMDGASDFVSLPTNVINGFTNFTFESWVYPTSSSSWQRIFDFGKSSSTGYIFLTNSWNNNNLPRFAITTGTNTGEQTLSSSTVMPLNTWSHIAIVLNATAQSATMYLNGSQVATGSITLNPSALGTITAAYLGKSFWADPFLAGRIDEVRIWNTARTGTDISNNYQKELSGNESGLVAYYNFNQGTPNGSNTGLSSLIDKTANNYNATLNTFDLSGTSSNFIAGSIPVITATGNASSLSAGSTLQLSNTLTGGVWSSSNTSIATVDANTGLVNGGAAGSVTISYTICGKVATYNLTVITPTITTTGTLKTFASCSGASITPQSFTVAGNNLSANVIVTAPTGFEISTASGGTYTSTLTLTPSSGTVASSSVFVRLINSSTTASSGVISVTSTGAVSRTVAATVNTDNALNFDGINDIVSTAGSLSALNITGDITVETWVKLNQIPTDWLRLVGKGSANNRTFGLWVANNGTVLWQIFGLTTFNLQTTNILEVGKWYHIAATRSGNTLKIYINSVEVASTITSGVGNTNTEPLELGGTSTIVHASLNGSLDEVRVWNVARTASQILDNYLVGLGGNETGLVAYYNFDQGTINGPNTAITSLADRTANAINGTLTNFAKTGTSSNFVAGFIPDITATGNATTVLVGSTLLLSNGLTGGTWSSSNASLATINATTGLTTGVAVGSVTMTYTICSKTVSYNLTVITPTITTTGLLKTFASCSGATITPQSFAVAGTNLSASVTVSAPAGFEISTASGGTYSSTLSLTPSAGTLSSTSVFVRLINSSTTASSGVISVTSMGAVSRTVTTTVNTDNALNFDGVDDYVTLPNESSFDFTNQVTVEAWIKVATFDKAWQAIVTKGDDSWRLHRNSSSNFINFAYTNTSNGVDGVTSNIEVNDNKWHHVAGVYNGSSLSIYIDGALNQSVNVSTTIKNSNNPVIIGNNFDPGLNVNNRYFNGNIDEVRIWNVARTASQIQATYLTELAGNETGLVANYNFNQGIGGGDNQSISSLMDRSTNAINGTITNFTKTGTSSNFVAGFIPDITAAGNATTVLVGSTLQLSNVLTGGTWSTSNSSLATINATTGLTTGVAAGSVSMTYTICSKTVSYNLTVITPTITTSGTLSTFNSCLGTASASQTFTVSAQFLTSNLVLTAPAGYELSTTAGGTYSSTLSIAPTSGTVSARLIYVRLSASAVNGQSGNIVITSTDAVTQNIATGNAAVTRSVAASVTISSDATNNAICSGSNIVFTATPTNGGNAPSYQWKLNNSNITGANSSTYSTTSLTNNAAISVSMTSSLSSCVTGSPASSNTITTTVTSVPSTPGAISGLTTICLNSNQVYSVPSVSGATSYTWVVTGDISATVSSTTNVINITAANTQGSGSLEVFANNACGTSVASSSLSITVNNTPAPTASFTVSPSTTVCLTSPSVTFSNTSTANANSTLTAYNWNFGDGSLQATTDNASRTFTASGNFDVVMNVTSSNQCTSSFSSRIIVDPISVAGTASVANNAICEGATTVLTLAGNTGAIQWQSSTDGNSFANISGANSATYTTPNLTATTYYKAVVTSGSCTSANSGVITVTVNPTPSVTLASLANINNLATSFNLSYSNVIGGADEYSITAVAPNAMPNFVAISNYGLPASPITVSIPASPAGTYNFNLVVKNGSLGCVSVAIPFTQTVISAGSSVTVTGPTTYTFNNTPQGPNTNTKTGSTGAVTYSYAGTGSTTYTASATQPTNVGTYRVIATLAAVANYSGATSAPYAFTITAASSTITVTGTTTYTFNNTPQGPATNTSTGSTGGVTYSYAGTGSTTYGPSATAPTNVGTYQVIATLAADANYTGATSAPYAFTITAASSTITITGSTTFTFNGSAQGPNTNTKTGSSGAVTYSYAGTGSTTYMASATAPTNVGTYQVIATLAADANYTGATSAPYAFTITAASSTITVTGTTTYTFNNTPQGPNTNTKTGSSGGVTYSYTGTGSTTYTASATAPTNVGTYQVIATLAADANYSGATSAPYAFTISAAGSTITVTGTTTYTFNNTPQGPATNTSTGSSGGVTYSYAGTGSTTYTASATQPTNVGTYQVIASLAADANYSGATSAPYAFIINDAPSVISINRVESTPTNLSTLRFLVTFSKDITGFDVGDLTIINTGTVSTTTMVVSSVTSSTYTVTVGGITGNGTLGLDLKSSGTAIIDAYGAGITNGITGQVYTIDKITVTPSFITPATNDNFVGTSLGISVNIPEANLPNTITLTFAGVSNTVTVTLNNGSGVIAGNLNLNNLSVSSIVLSSSQSTLPSDIYTVTLSYQDYLGNPVASTSINNFKVNYNLPSTIVVTGLTTFTFNGAAQGPATNTKTGSTGAVTYSYAGTGSTTYGPIATLPTNAGTYQVIATLAADANFSAATSDPYAFTINKLAPLMSFGNILKTMGDINFTMNATSTSGGSITFSIVNANIATVLSNTVTLTGVGITTITVTQAETENYTAATTTASLTVNPAAPRTSAGTFIFGNPSNPSNTSGLISPNPGATLNFYSVATGGTLSSVQTLPTIVGVYTFFVSQTINGIESLRVPYTVTIRAAGSTIVVTGATTYTFNGASQGPSTNTKTGSSGAVTYRYAGTGSTTYTASSTAPTNVGTYQVIATLAADANYTGAVSAPYAFTISAAGSTIVVTGATTYTFNGAAQGPATNIKTGSSGGVTYSYVGTGSTTYTASATAPTNAGTYIVFAILAADASFSSATSAPYAFTISAAGSTITVTGLTTFTFNGAAQGPATNTKTGSSGGVTYSYTGTGSTTYTASATAPTNAGTYQVIATLDADANFSAATSASYAFIINKLAPVISLADIVKTLGDPNFTMNATSTSSGSITYSIVNANIATVNSNTVSLAGVGVTTITVAQAETENYTAATTTASLTVKPAAPGASAGTFIIGNPSNPSNTTGLINPSVSASLNFYSAATGGTPSSVQTLPTIVGVYTFFVSQTINGIEGPRVSYTVTILPSITVKSNTYIVGAINNPSNISSLVTGVTIGSKPRWCNVSGLNCSDIAPALPSTPGVYIWCVKAVDIATGLESPGCVYDTVTILAPATVMAVQKKASALTLQPDGTYTMDFTFTLTNNLSVTLDSIQLIDNLSALFTSPSTYKVIGVTASGTLVASTTFNGSSVTNLLLPASKLGANKTETVVLKLQVLPQTYAGTLTNNVTAYALSPYGTFGSPASASFVVPAVSLFISDVITPNQDGKNDQWIIVKPSNKQLKVEIVNRWGQRVFANPDYQNNFVGRGTGSFLGQDLAEGTYFYFIEIVDRVTGVKEFRKGYLTLKR